MARVPTSEEVEAAVMHYIMGLNIRGGEIFNPVMMSIELQRTGFRSKEIVTALETLGSKGYFENGPSHFIKLTDAGFAALDDGSITTEELEMSFASMMTDTLTLVKADGTVIKDDIRGSVQLAKNKIITFEVTLPFERDDHVLRRLPNGMVDDFVVVEPGFHNGMGSIPASFQITVTRAGAAMAQDKVVNQITNNFHGHNVRINTNSTDNSINIVGSIAVADVSAFLDQLRPAIAALPSPQKNEMAAPLAILEDEIRKPAPSQSRLRDALGSIKTIAEGAAGNLIAAGIQAGVVHLLT